MASGGKTRTLTRLNADFLAGKRLGEVRELSATARDGGRVPGWLVLPPNYVDGQRVPTILEIHGGPYASYGPHFSTDYQLYAAAGYAVSTPTRAARPATARRSPTASRRPTRRAISTT